MTEPTLVELLRAGHNTQYNCTRAADALDALAARLAEAVDTLRNTAKPVRELLWCLTVWNDHNFTEADLIHKLMLARKGLGLDGVDRVEKANALLAEIDAVTADSAPANPNTGHGHVRPRPDGVRMRCGGPGVCAECSREAARAAGSAGEVLDLFGKPLPKVRTALQRFAEQLPDSAPVVCLCRSNWPDEPVNPNCPVHGEPEDSAR